MTPDEVSDLRRWIDQSGGIADGRPFLGDRRLDALVDVVLEMSAQLWVLRRRNAFLEEVLAGKGVITASEVEQHEASGDLAGALRAERAEFISTIFRSLAELPQEVQSDAQERS